MMHGQKNIKLSTHFLPAGASSLSYSYQQRIVCNTYSSVYPYFLVKCISFLQHVVPSNMIRML